MTKVIKTKDGFISNKLGNIFWITITKENNIINKYKGTYFLSLNFFTFLKKVNNIIIIQINAMIYNKLTAGPLGNNMPFLFVIIIGKNTINNEIIPNP